MLTHLRWNIHFHDLSIYFAFSLKKFMEVSSQCFFGFLPIVAFPLTWFVTIDCRDICDVDVFDAGRAGFCWIIFGVVRHMLSFIMLSKKMKLLLYYLVQCLIIKFLFFILLRCAVYLFFQNVLVLFFLCSLLCATVCFIIAVHYFWILFYRLLVFTVLFVFLAGLICWWKYFVSYVLCVVKQSFNWNILNDN